MKRSTILILDPLKDTSNEIKTCFKQSKKNYSIILAPSIQSVSGKLSALNPDCIVAHCVGSRLHIPDVTTFATSMASLPLLLIIDDSQAKEADSALSQGATDFIIHEHINAFTLPKAVDNSVKLYQFNREFNQFKQAAEYSPSTVLITNVRGDITYVNPKFTELTGFSREEALGKNPRILKSGAQDNEFYKAMWAAIIKMGSWKGVFHNKKKNGDLYWEFASISAYTNRKGKIESFIAVKEDITAQKLAEDKLTMSEQNLREKNAIIQRDLSIAQRAHDALVIKNPPVSNYMIIDYRYEPMEDIGGDYFSFPQINNDHTGVFIADVSGHGIAAALFIALLNAETESIFQKTGAQPGESLTELNKRLHGKMSSHYITGIYSTFKKNDDGRVLCRFANGGHPAPIIIKSDGSVANAPEGDTLIGISDMTEYAAYDYLLEKGDMIFFFTDGIPETTNVYQDQIGHDKDLFRLFARAKGKNVSDTLDNVFDEVLDFAGDAPQQDDVLIIGVEIT